MNFQCPKSLPKKKKKSSQGLRPPRHPHWALHSERNRGPGCHINLNNHIYKGKVSFPRNSPESFSVGGKKKKKQVKLSSGRILHPTDQLQCMVIYKEALWKPGSFGFMTLLSQAQIMLFSLAFQTPTWRSQCCCSELRGKYRGTWSLRNHQCPGEQQAFFYHGYTQPVTEEISQISKGTQKFEGKTSS